MFMLAATTASIVLHRWISSENLSSGARLKANEAYQASESGLNAVHGWLANNAADAGAMLTQYESSRQPILLENLGSLGGARNQNYKVYLIGADITTTPMKLKFMSVGKGRDNSEARQTSIFSVNGLYKLNAPGYVPSQKCEGEDCDFKYAFFGGFSSNTQGKFSSAVINGDMTINGFTSNKSLLVTGNLSTMDNGDKKIGCPPDGSDEPPGNLYVVGDFNVRGFIICGDAYVGGKVITSTGPVFQGDLYAAGGISKGSPLTVQGNLTLKDMLSSTNNDGMAVLGNLVMEEKGNINFFNDIFANNPNLDVKGSVWINENFAGTKNRDKAGHVKLGSGNAIVYVPNVFEDPAGSRVWKNSNVYFTASNVKNPSNTNKPDGANDLADMASKVENCPGRGLCVPDPLELPAETKAQWLAAADKLQEMANPANAVDTAKLKSISNSCLRLLKEKNSNSNHDIQGKWLGCGLGSQTKFTEYVNQCYADLKNYDSGSLLYNKQFLAVHMDGTCNGDPRGVLRGSLIFVFKNNVSANIKLGETAQDANIFIYLMQGATGKMAFTGSRNDGKHRNYFIFSEKDIAGASGSTTISGAIFLANSSKSGAITDTDINFNESLYNALIESGILYFKNNSGNNAPPPDPELIQKSSITDIHWIPTSSRLAVKLESKQISLEKEPVPSAMGKLSQSVLVMPRIVRIATNEFANINDLRKYYAFMYLNGAIENSEANMQPNCTSHPDGSISLGTILPLREGMYVCNFSNANEQQISNFYLRISGDKSGTAVTESEIASSSSKQSSSSEQSSIASSSSAASGGSITMPSDSCTTIAKEEEISPVSGNCYKYTPTENYDCKVKAYVTSNGPINVKAMCNGQTYSGNIAAYNWTDFFNCGIRNEVTININSASSGARMKMNCW
jgi:hypothetical protein